jgi:hypothetical protein
MDGRIQLPVISWIRRNFKYDFIDMITEPGMDGILAKSEVIRKKIVDKINISVEKHGSNHIFIVGHEDCAGNPGDEMAHRAHIQAALNYIAALNMPVDITGLWATIDGEIKEVPTNNLI